MTQRAIIQATGSDGKSYLVSYERLDEPDGQRSPEDWPTLYAFDLSSLERFILTHVTKGRYRIIDTDITLTSDDPEAF